MTKGMWAVVAVVVAVLAFIAVPNVLTARNRSRQKRTMADMRTVSMAWEARATDTNSYSIGAAPRSPVAADAEHFARLRPVTLDELARALEPTYVRKLPREDGWGNPLDVRIGAYDDQGRAQLYAIRSSGSDRRVDSASYAYGMTTNFAQDLLHSNGTFVRFPEGM